MFLDLLNAPQRESFLILASRVAISDGEDSSEEMDAIEELKKEMGIY